MTIKTKNVKKQYLLHRLRLFVSTCVIGAFSILALNNASAQESVRVGHFSWPGYGFHYVAEANNLTDLKFENTIIEDPVQLFSLLATNQLDVVFSTIEFGTETITFLRDCIVVTKVLHSTIRPRVSATCT